MKLLNVIITVDCIGWHADVDLSNVGILMTSGSTLCCIVCLCIALLVACENDYHF